MDYLRMLSAHLIPQLWSEAYRTILKNSRTTQSLDK